MLHAARIFVLLFVVAGLPGCYEGWEYDKKDGSGDDPTPPPPPIPTIPPLFYVLFEPIYLTDDAVADDGCFPNDGIAEFRKSEWAQRVASLSAALAGIAQNFVLRPRPVTKDDCDTLTVVRGAAISAKPWAPDPDPADDPLDRPLIELRAVFWEGDVELDPPDVVLKPNWFAWDKMVQSGRKARTVTHFVLEHSTEGYFSSWSGATATDARVDGTPIDNVDPSDAGIAARAATIKADTAQVVQWLLSQP